jgi:hypothetical protein
MNQPHSVADYLSLLEPDEWRARVGFSSEVEAVNRELFRPGLPEEGAARLLGKWLERHQPCLFGRIAARAGALSYCILSEKELRQSDESIKDKIQARRLEWTREGFEGRKSGFVILAASQALALARPGPIVQELARRLCYLYLETDIEMNEIHTDQLYLQKPGSRLTTWRWLTGVNYFSAQGDGRWWQDHRIPGGMAFSVNSVGHLVKSGIVAKAMKGLDESTRAPFEDYPEPKVDSLDKALELAMRTIGMASDAVSGKATKLLPLPSDRGSLPVTECPVKLSDKVADKNFCEYRGYYHTDYTLPSEYFLPDVERAAGVIAHTLDFTYLFHRDVDNPDFRLMGEGHQIRAAPGRDEALARDEYQAARLKQLRGDAEEVLIDEHQGLVDALKFRS